MRTILFLDDDPERHRLFRERAKQRLKNVRLLQVYDPDKAVSIIAREGPSLEAVYLDRDLGLPITGEDVVLEMTRLPIDRRPKKVIVHSLNESRAPVMVKMLERAGYEVEQVPFEYS